LDEVPTNQAGVNDSRAHISNVIEAAEGTPTSIHNSAQLVQSWPKGALVLQPDEGIFMNNAESGTATGSARANIWYED